MAAATAESAGAPTRFAALVAAVAEVAAEDAADVAAASAAFTSATRSATFANSGGTGSAFTMAVTGADAPSDAGSMPANDSRRALPRPRPLIPSNSMSTVYVNVERSAARISGPSVAGTVNVTDCSVVADFGAGTTEDRNPPLVSRTVRDGRIVAV